ncbi:MAG: glycosyl hydrolase family 18 protein [Cytophagales bacterium]
MRKINKILVSLLLLCSTWSSAQKLAAYFPSYRSGVVNSMQWDKLTDVYFAFINANTNGTLITTNPSDAVFGFDPITFDAVKVRCQQNNVRLHISVGGADKDYQRAQRLRDISRNATARSTFATAIVNFAINNNLAGINLDWEFPNESIGGVGGNTTDLFNLTNAVRNAINSSTRPGLVLGIAVGGEWAGTFRHTNYISTSGANSVLNLFDEFHIMAYDFPPGTSGLPYNVNHHSSVADAKKCLEEWNLQRNIPYSKMVLGVPFYGRTSSRGTGNDIDNMYNRFSNSNPSSAFANANGSFTANGVTWYYDSKTQLDAKIDDAIGSKGCMGVFIWDLGQDRTDQFSLLSAMKTKVDAACPIGTPNLGPDVGFCSGSVTLNSNLQTASGRTFTWQKDGVNISGFVNSTTATTYNTNQGGVYKVIVKQGNCQKEDEIVVQAGASFTANGATRCGAGSVTLSVNASEGNYDWFDSPAGGSKLLEGGSGNGGGRSFTTNVTATTDFYIQKNTGSQTFSAGKQTFSNSPLDVWNEGAKNDNNTKPKFAQKLRIFTDVTIASVKVFKNTGYAVPDAKVIIYKSNGATVHAESATLNIGSSESVVVVPVNITLQGTSTGTDYYIAIYSNNNGGVFYLDRNQGASDYTQAGVFTLNRFAYRSFTGDFGISGSEQTHYGQLFDIQITTGIPDPCGRVKVTATVNPGADVTKIANPVAHRLCPNADGVVRINNSESGATYQLVQGTTNIGSPVEGNGSTINLTVPSNVLLAGLNVFNVNVAKIGCGASPLTDTVGFNVTPFPNVSYTASSSAAVCLGTNATVNLSGSQTGRSYQVFNGANALGTAVAGTGNAITLSVPTNNLSAGMNSLVVRVLTTGCSNTDITDTVGVRVNAIPAQPSTITTPSTLCVGTAAPFSVTNVSGVTYNWTSATGTITGSGNAVNINYSSAGAKTVSVTATQNGCTSTARTAEVTATAVPAQPSAIQGNTDLCTNIASQYSVTNVSGLTYNWTSVGGNITGTGNSVSISYSTISSKVISVTASQNGCVSPARTLNVMVNAPVAPGLTYTNVVKTFGDAAFNMTATSNSSGAITYSVVSSTPSGIVSINPNTGLVTITGAGSATIRASQEANGCFTALTREATLLVNKANRTITITSPNSGQQGTSVNLTATVNPSASVQWSVANGTGSASVSGSSMSLVSNGTVTVTATVPADANYNLATTNQSFTISALTTPSLTFNNVTKTFGDAPFNMTASSNSPGAITYSIESGASFASINSSTGQVTILGAGNVVVRASQAASGTFAATSITANLTINKAQGTVNITSANSGDVGNSINLTATSNSSGTLTWSIIQGTSASVLGSTLSLTSQGQVTIQVSLAETANYTGTTATQVVTVNGPNSVFNPSFGFAPALQVVPNPVINNAKINVSIAQGGNMKLELIAVDGSSSAVIADEFVSAGQYSYDIVSLRAGMYVVKLKLDNKVYTTYLIKQ